MCCWLSVCVHASKVCGWQIHNRCVRVNIGMCAFVASEALKDLTFLSQWCANPFELHQLHSDTVEGGFQPHQPSRLWPQYLSHGRNQNKSVRRDNTIKWAVNDFTVCVCVGQFYTEKHKNNNVHGFIWWCFHFWQVYKRRKRQHQMYPFSNLIMAHLG